MAADRMSEADLCTKFRGAAESDGWIVYPEISGWDLVLSWPGDFDVISTRKTWRGHWEGVEAPRVGDQVGVEAKLRANVSVLAQVISRRTCPAFQAVLVPVAGTEFITVASALGIGVYTLRHCEPWRYRRESYDRDRKTIVQPMWRNEDAESLWLPPIVPTTIAGVPSPRPLTPWRVKAIQLCAKLRAEGFITSHDFDVFNISPRVWVDRWIVREGHAHDRRRARYVAKPGADLPDVGFEAERDALMARDRTAQV